MLVPTILKIICWHQTHTHLDHRNAEVAIDEGCGSAGFHWAQLQGERESQSWNSLLPYSAPCDIWCHFCINFPPVCPYFDSRRNTLERQSPSLGTKTAHLVAPVFARMATRGHLKSPLSLPFQLTSLLRVTAKFETLRKKFSLYHSPRHMYMSRSFTEHSYYMRYCLLFSILFYCLLVQIS